MKKLIPLVVLIAIAAVIQQPAWADIIPPSELERSANLWQIALGGVFMSLGFVYLGFYLKRRVLATKPIESQRRRFDK